MSGSYINLDDTTGMSRLQKSAFGELKVISGLAKVLVHFPYNINTERVNTVTTGSGTVTHANFMANLNTTAATNSSAQLISKEVVEYKPGSGVECRFTSLFTTGVAGSEQIMGVGNDVDGYFVGYNGASFGIMTRNNSVDTWISQSNFNLDTLDGNGASGMVIDPTKGNVFRISFQWLGYGSICYCIEHPDSGMFIPVHRIKYANANTVPSSSNPSLPIMAKVTNSTNNTAIILKTASMSAYSDSIESEAGKVEFAESNTKSVTTETNVLTIRNKATFQSVANQVRVRPDFISFAADGTKNVTINVYINATLGGTPAYTDISTNTSVCDYDIAGTTITGGRKVLSFSLGKTGNVSEIIKNLNIILHPNDTFTIAALSSSSSDVTASITWAENFR